LEKTSPLKGLGSPIPEENIAGTMLQLSITWKVRRALRIDPSKGHVHNDLQTSAPCRREYER
jgi:hypothetical protein